MKRKTFGWCVALVAIAMMIQLVAPVQAVTLVWDGGGSSRGWSIVQNWVGDPVNPPASGVDSVSFATGTATYAVMNYAFVLGGSQSITQGGVTELRVDHDLTLSSGSTLNLAISGSVLNVLPATAGDDPTITVEAGASVTARRLLTGRADYDSTWKFIADAAGVSTVNVTERLYIRGRTDLIVDLTDYNIENGTTLVLFGYAILNEAGPFNSVTLTRGWSGTIDYITDNKVRLVNITPPPRGTVLSIR